MKKLLLNLFSMDIHANFIDNAQMFAHEAMELFKNKVVFANVVHRDFENMFQSKGDVLNVTIPGDFSVNDKAEGGSIFIQNITGSKIQLELNNHKEVSFQIEDREKGRTPLDLASVYAKRAVKALVKDLEQKLADLSKEFYNFYGTPGTTPDKIEYLTYMKQRLDNEDIDDEDRVIILEGETNAKMSAIDSIISATNNLGDITEGKIKRIAGFQILESNKLGFVENSSDCASTLINNVAGYAVGVKTVTVDGSTNPVTVGSLFTIPGYSSEGYVVTASTATSITFEPGLRHAVSDNDALAFQGGNSAKIYSSFAFQKNAIVLAIRPLAVTNAKNVGQAISTYDGVSLRVTISYDSAKLAEVITYDMLYGYAITDRKAGARLIR